MPYRTEDDFWNDYYDTQDEAEREAQKSAEMVADLWDFDTEEERDEFIQREFESEFERLMNEKKGR